MRFQIFGIANCNTKFDIPNWNLKNSSLRKTKTFQIVLGPVGPDKEGTDDVRRESIVRVVVVNHHPPLVGVPIDALAAFAFGELKALMFEGANDTTDRDVAKTRKRWVRGHTVTATAGFLMT